jgi:hypothetical protein
MSQLSMVNVQSYRPAPALSPSRYTATNLKRGKEMKLTPAQEQVITDAQHRENNRVVFYGMPAKSIEKLIDNGYVTIVSFLETEEKFKVRLGCADMARRLIVELEAMQDRSAAKIVMGLRNEVAKLSSTMYVLTRKGKDYTGLK